LNIARACPCRACSPKGRNLAACGSRASPSGGPPSGWQAGRVHPRGARPIRLPQAFSRARVNFAGAFVTIRVSCNSRKVSAEDRQQVFILTGRGVPLPPIATLVLERIIQPPMPGRPGCRRAAPYLPGRSFPGITPYLFLKRR